MFRSIMPTFTDEIIFLLYDRKNYRGRTTQTIKSNLLSIFLDRQSIVVFSSL